MVTRLTVTFDQLINLASPPTSAFQLKRQSDNASVTLNADVLGNAVVLTFTGGAVNGASLADGRYTLTVVAAQVNGGNFDGNGDGTASDDYVLVGNTVSPPKLFRLFGDSDGNGMVNGADFLAFRLAFQQGADPIFDFNGDGVVNGQDFLQFRLRFLHSI